MHCALTGQLTRRGEGLGEGLSGTDVEDPDDMTAVVLVDDADRLSDRDLEFGGEDVDALAAVDPVAGAGGDAVVVVGRRLVVGGTQPRTDGLVVEHGGTDGDSGGQCDDGCDDHRPGSHARRPSRRSRMSADISSVSMPNGQVITRSPWSSMA